MDKTLSEIRKEIAAKEKELEMLKRQQKIMQLEPTEHMLAKALHSRLCHHNHIDGCSWMYETRRGEDGVEITDWSAYAHDYYLGTAKQILRYCQEHNITPDDAIALIGLIRG